MLAVRAVEVTDGNVNFSYAISGRAGTSLFVKEARDYLDVAGRGRHHAAWVQVAMAEREAVEGVEAVAEVLCLELAHIAHQLRILQLAVAVRPPAVLAMGHGLLR